MNALLFRVMYYNTNYLYIANHYLIRFCKKTKLISISRSLPYASNRCVHSSQIDSLTYERIADKTLDYLNEDLETIIAKYSHIKDTDVSLSNGVLTLNLGTFGIYVINKQTPNKQIWLSSPISGPKRYDLINGKWIYKYDGISINDLLSKELSHIFDDNLQIKIVDFSKMV